MRFLKPISLLLVSILFLASCGYRPSAYYAKQELGKDLFVRLDVTPSDPKNSVLVKDAINQLLIQKLDTQLVNDESLADTVMNIVINSVSMQTLQYDKTGSNKLYTAFVNINVSYFKKSDNKRKSFVIDGEDNFSVENGTSINDTERFKAIKSASDKALDEILSKIAVSSYKK